MKNTETKLQDKYKLMHQILMLSSMDNELLLSFQNYSNKQD